MVNNLDFYAAKTNNKIMLFFIFISYENRDYGALLYVYEMYFKYTLNGKPFLLKLYVV